MGEATLMEYLVVQERTNGLKNRSTFSVVALKGKPWHFATYGPPSVGDATADAGAAEFCAV